MSYTKREFIVAAFEELGLASYVFDLPPNDFESALRRIDSMVADWNGRGIRLSYPLPSKPSLSDLDADTFVPDYANEAIILNLAIKLASSFGKTPSNDTRINAHKSFNNLLVKASKPIEMQFDRTIPSGAGNKNFFNTPFLDSPVENIEINPDDLEL